MDFEKEYANMMKAIVIIAENAENGGTIEHYKVAIDSLKSTAQEYLNEIK